jgi:hypothetical protein
MFDDEAGGLMKAILIVMFLPFYLTWKIGKWLIVMLWDKKQDRTFARWDTERKEASDKAAEEYSEARSKQIGQLIYEAVQKSPKTPATKLRATFHQGSIEVPRRILSYDYKRGGMATQLMSQTDKIYVVCARVDFSETERAIIEGKELQEVELDRQPYYTRAEIKQLKEYRDISRKNDSDEAVAFYERHIHDERVIDVRMFLKGLVYFEFESSHEAQQYFNKLKVKILPQIKSLVEEYSVSNASEVVEF